MIFFFGVCVFLKGRNPIKKDTINIQVSLLKRKLAKGKESIQRGYS